MTFPGSEPRICGGSANGSIDSRVEYRRFVACTPVQQLTAKPGRANWANSRGKVAENVCTQERVITPSKKLPFGRA